jgi:succinyl-diaminopimelate desuccinylase
MWIDVRTTPDCDHEALLAELRGAVAASAAAVGIESDVEVIDDRPAVATAEDHPLVTAVADAHAAVTGTAPRLGGVPGATDGTIITSRAGVPSVVYGPGGKWIAHQADEFVEIADLVTHAEVYVEAADRFLRRGEPPT